MNITNTNKAFNLLSIKFSYNGDLGILQQKTKDNIETCGKLAQWEIITYEEYQEVIKVINNYFLEQIQKVAENPLFYTN